MYSGLSGRRRALRNLSGLLPRGFYWVAKNTIVKFARWLKLRCQFYADFARIEANDAKLNALGTQKPTVSKPHEFYPWPKASWKNNLSKKIITIRSND